MESFPEQMNEYRKQLAKGAIQEAYRGLLYYIMELRTHFEKNHPECFVSSVYHGYMDMTYFSCTPETWQRRKLKAAIVFVHDRFRFEVWLAGYNKQVQAKYWRLLKESGWDKYHLVPTPKGVDSILEHTLVAEPDFRDLEALTMQIERTTMQFISDVESFISEH